MLCGFAQESDKSVVVCPEMPGHAHLEDPGNQKIKTKRKRASECQKVEVQLSVHQLKSTCRHHRPLVRIKSVLSKKARIEWVSMRVDVGPVWSRTGLQTEVG